MNLIALKILIKLIQCILQNRICVEKKQIRHFDEINKILEKDKSKAFEANLFKFLDQLLLVEKYNLSQKIVADRNHDQIIILFRLIHKSTGAITKAEVWCIEFEQYRQIEQQHDQQEFEIITTLFEELVFFLNRQPLFSEYHRNILMKNSYILDHQLRILSQKQKQNEIYKQHTIVELPHKYTKQRVCKSFIFKIQCYYLPKFDHLLENLDKTKQPLSIKSKKQQQTLDTSKKSIVIDSDSEKTNKTSIYQLYDKQLDFLFLASDDESFKNSPKNQVKEYDLNYACDTQEEFELLLISKDDEFLDENKNYFSQLSGYEKKYLKN